MLAFECTKTPPFRLFIICQSKFHESGSAQKHARSEARVFCCCAPAICEFDDSFHESDSVNTKQENKKMTLQFLHSCSIGSSIRTWAYANLHALALRQLYLAVAHGRFAAATAFNSRETRAWDTRVYARYYSILRTVALVWVSLCLCMCIRVFFVCVCVFVVCLRVFSIAPYWRVGAGLDVCVCFLFLWVCCVYVSAIVLRFQHLLTP